MRLFHNLPNVVYNIWKNYRLMLYFRKRMKLISTDEIAGGVFMCLNMADK
jgi:hypothetical protein